MVWQTQKQIGIVILLALQLSACRGGPQPAAKAPPIPENAKKYPVKQITTLGRNERPHFDNDGASIFFIASDRTGHSHRQAYQYFLASQRDRRLTFQDGDIESIIPGAKGHDIYYASSTDEIKESPDFIRSSLKQSVNTSLDFFGRTLNRNEIYASDLNGDKITRLTRSPGYDGDLSPRRGKNEFVFVSTRDGNLDIYAMISGNVARVTSSKEAEFSPALSDKGELVFVRGELSATPPLITQLYIADTLQSKSRALTTEAAVHLTPQWHPKAPWIVFTMNYPDPQNYELYWMRKDGKCLERLTYSAENERSPSFSPDGTTLAFSRDVSGSSQLFLMSNLVPPDCAL